MFRFVLGVLVTLGVIAAAGFIVVLTGAYDVAATSPHTPAMRWALNSTMQNSVRRQASDITAPATLTEAQARRGYRHYSESCVYCHGAPGADPTDWSGGMLPEPPYMPDAAKEWSDALIFWIVKHGIKMSGMPAFGAHVPDDGIWDIVAFVRRLPDMTPEAYAAYGEAPEPSSPAPAQPTR